MLLTYSNSTDNAIRLYELAWSNVHGAVRDVAALKNAPAREEDCVRIAMKILSGMEPPQMHAFVHYGDRAVAKAVADQIIADLDVIAATNMICTLAGGIGVHDLDDERLNSIRDDLLSWLKNEQGTAARSLCWPSQQELDAMAAMRFGDTTITTEMLGKLVIPSIGHA